MRLLRVAAGRVGAAVVTPLLVSVLIFAAEEVLPGDVATRLLGREATPLQVSAFRERLHLNDPAPLRRELGHPEPVPRDGTIELPTGPGLGITLNEEVVARWRTDRG